MGVYIKGFPLPNNCGACPLRLAWCRERIYMVTRPERCPLTPVPKHGRLIEADRIELYMQDEWMNNELSNGDWILFRERLNETPTIIPAE